MLNMDAKKNFIDALLNTMLDTLADYRETLSATPYDDIAYEYLIRCAELKVWIRVLKNELLEMGVEDY